MQKKNPRKSTPLNKDGLLKSVLQDTFIDAIRFIIPDADEIYDFNKKIVFLDKELDLLLVGRKKGRGRVGDLLVKVARRDGGLQYFLIHLELQAQRDDNFAERMYTCYYRIRDKFHVPVMSLVIYADGDTSFCPDHYQEELGGTKIDFQFNTYKILHQDEDELKRSDNVFALVVRAIKLALLKGLKDDMLLMEMGKELALEMQRVKLSYKRKFMLLWFLRNYVNFNDSKNVIIFEKQIDDIMHSKKEPFGVIEYVKSEYEKFYRNKARREARKEAKREKSAAFVTNLIQETKFSDDKIAHLAEVSVDFVLQIRNQLKSK